jgi:rubredoxin
MQNRKEKQKMKKIKCPCCGNYTFEDCGGDGPLFEICDVCGWMYDPVTHSRPDTLRGANGITLNEARENYRKYGYYDKRLMEISSFRDPYPDELPENNE